MYLAGNDQKKAVQVSVFACVQHSLLIKLLRRLIKICHDLKKVAAMSCVFRMEELQFSVFDKRQIMANAIL